MNCLRYWARYVRKGEVKGGGIKNENEYPIINLVTPTTSVQIVLCNFFLYINNIHKYYSVSRCIISITIMFAPAQSSNQITSPNRAQTNSLSKARREPKKIKIKTLGSRDFS